ncbi:MAG: type II secretion system protein GspE, partial [Nitrospinae bacterium]|nr:type II secretion system protein GspE [Nitrospinota bacterium]
MNSGYRGRSGIYEYLRITDGIRSRIVKGADSKEIRQAAILEGMHTLRRDGIRRIIAGETTLDEVLRVTEETDGI